ncbi:MAG: ComF family protein, partial [Hyphomicrobiales bacterium]|nr:ComF family protein [Hyphomicrobiales bacterium]
MAATRRVVELLFPPTCLACSAATAAPGALCAACWRRMHFVARPYCERLGTPFPVHYGDGLISPQAAADPPVYGRARCVALFDDGPVRALVHGLKY